MSEIHSRLHARANQNDYRAVEETSGLRPRVDFNALAADYRNLAQLVVLADTELSAVHRLNRELVSALDALVRATRSEIEWRVTQANRSGSKLTKSRQADVDALDAARTALAKVKWPAPLV